MPNSLTSGNGLVKLESVRLHREMPQTRRGATLRIRYVATAPSTSAFGEAALLPLHFLFRCHAKRQISVPFGTGSLGELEGQRLLSPKLRDSPERKQDSPCLSGRDPSYSRLRRTGKRTPPNSGDGTLPFSASPCEAKDKRRARRDMRDVRHETSPCAASPLSQLRGQPHLARKAT